MIVFYCLWLRKTHWRLGQGTFILFPVFRREKKREEAKIHEARIKKEQERLRKLEEIDRQRREKFVEMRRKTRDRIQIRRDLERERLRIKKCDDERQVSLRRPPPPRRSLPPLPTLDSRSHTRGSSLMMMMMMDFIQTH